MFFVWLPLKLQSIVVSASLLDFEWYWIECRNRLTKQYFNIISIPYATALLHQLILPLPYRSLVEYLDCWKQAVSTARVKKKRCHFHDQILSANLLHCCSLVVGCFIVVRIIISLSSYSHSYLRIARQQASRILNIIRLYILPHSPSSFFFVESGHVNETMMLSYIQLLLLATKH